VCLIIAQVSFMQTHISSTSHRRSIISCHDTHRQLPVHLPVIRRVMPSCVIPIDATGRWFGNHTRRHTGQQVRIGLKRQLFLLQRRAGMYTSHISHLLARLPYDHMCIN
jgi:hypothetical protein